MTIRHRSEENKGTFYVEKDGKQIGTMAYLNAGNDRIIIDHTEVDPSLRNEGVGEQLLLEAVKYARTEKIKIDPLCPFSKSIFDKNNDFKDVL